MQNTDQIECGPRKKMARKKMARKKILHELIQQRIQQSSEAENNRKLQE